MGIKKNILMIIPNLQFGGAQKSFCKLANSLSDKHNVHICVFNTIGVTPYKLNGTLYDLKIAAGRNILEKIWYFIMRWYAIRTLKKRHNFNTTISYLEGANYLNILTKINDKVIISIRGSQYFDETITGFMGLLRMKILVPWLYKSADHLVALNHGIARELISGCGVPVRKVTVIPNYYDIADIIKKSIESLEPEYQMVFRKPVIIAVGRLAPEKGFHFLLDIFTEVKDLANLVFLGDGPYKEVLVDKARQLNLKVGGVEPGGHTGNFDIYFVGYHENPYKFVKRAHLLTILSSSEGGPNVLSEAMICGTLVLSADCPYGPREWLSPDSAVTCPIQTIEIGDYGVLLPLIDSSRLDKLKACWTNAIKHYLNDESARRFIEKNASERIKKFDIDHLMSAWQKII